MAINYARQDQDGSTMVEFILVIPVLLFMGMGLMQFALIYHAKSVLNYATFEAARTGAVNNAQIEVMRKELGYRLAPIYGGDGSLKMGAMALTRSMVAVNDVTATKIKIVNPTSGSFAAHGIDDTVVDRHGDSHSTLVIPNSHLRFNNDGPKSDGLNIKEANLLQIEVTFGYQMRLPIIDMKLPGVHWIMRNLMISDDDDNWMYYSRGMLPIKSTATVRMQSDAWEHQESPPVVRAFESAFTWVKDKIANGGGETNEHCVEPEAVGSVNPATGLPINNPIEELSASECSVFDDFIDPFSPFNANTC